MIGRVLGNRYEIVEKIGGGGMALVYKAKCSLLNRFVAIKILRPEFTNDEEFIIKFRRESQAAASLSHPNIVNIYDSGMEDNIYYIVMEYVEGKTLKQVIKEKGRINFKDTIDIAIQIGEALNHAHKNHLVHRDIKPHNILITDDNRVKVTDFGIARAATTSTVTNTSNVIGSVHYFSPEQARGGYTDEKSDIYSLGVVIYEMVTGRVPFEGESPISVALKHIQEEIIPPTDIDKSIPKSIENIIMKCVEKDQSLRYDNVQELLVDLRRVEKCTEDNSIQLKDYNDSPTRIMPAVKDDMIIEKDKKSVQNKKENKKSGKILTISAILLALLLTSALAFGFFYIKDYLTVEEVDVPSVVGLQEDEAKERIESLGLIYKVKNRVYSSEYSEGYVISQSEDADTVVKKGYPIEVVISKGQEFVDVPSLINEYSNEIDILLSEAELKEGNVSYEHSDIPVGIVIGQKPEPNARAPKGSKVDIVISQGPEINYVIMPSLIGKNVEEAKKDIIANGFAIGSIDYQANSDYAKDLVIAQNYPAGTEVEENTSINLVVSSGSAEDINNEGQNNTGDRQDETDGEPTDEDTQQEKAKDYIIKLPQDKEKVEVKIYKIQGDLRELVYNKTHDTSEEGIKVTLSGIARVRFEIYFDGEYKDSIDIDF